MEFLIGVGLVWWKLKVGVCQGYMIGFVLHAMVYFILCFPTVCVWKPAAGNELALQDNC